MLIKKNIIITGGAGLLGKEHALVVKILAYAGITLNKPGLVQIGTQLDQVKEQKEKQ